MLLIVITSIALITSAVYGLNKVFKTKICPICAGVSLTWLWGLFMYYKGIEIGDGNLFDPIMLAILMGGSVVGGMYMFKNRLPEGKNDLLFMTLFFLGGLVAVYSVIYQDWLLTGVGVVFELVLLYYFMKPFKHKDTNPRVAALEKQMEKCCD